MWVVRISALSEVWPFILYNPEQRRHAASVDFHNKFANHELEDIWIKEENIFVVEC